MRSTFYSELLGEISMAIGRRLTIRFAIHARSELYLQKRRWWPPRPDGCSGVGSVHQLGVYGLEGTPSRRLDQCEHLGKSRFSFEGRFPLGCGYNLRAEAGGGTRSSRRCRDFLNPDLRALLRRSFGHRANLRTPAKAPGSHAPPSNPRTRRR